MIRRFTSAPKPLAARRQVVGEDVRRRPVAGRSGCRRSGRGSPTPRPGRRCSTSRGRSPCGAGDTSSTIAPAASSAATASRTRASTPGSMPATKYSFGRPRRLPRSERGGLVVAVAASVQQLVRDGLRRRRRVALVAAGDRVEQRRRVAHVARERPDLVERAREGDDPVAAHPAVRRLEPDDPASARPAGGWSRRCPSRCDSGAWYAATAAAEPPLLPPGHAIEVPRVGRRAVAPMLGRRAHRELVHVRLAEDDRARRRGAAR